MPGRVFKIEEINTIGGTTPTGVQFASFEWDARRKNIPFRPWEFPTVQRTVRTDYPGADDPTEQILGPNFEPFTLRGVWDDRYNPQARLNPKDPADASILASAASRTMKGLSAAGRAAAVKQGGYAVLEWQKFEDMVRRGNFVLITFEEVKIQGIITAFTPSYLRSSLIGYEFTVSPHHRQPGGFFALKRSPRTVLNATQLRDEAAQQIDEAVVINARAPQSRLVDTVFLDVDEHVDEWVVQLAAIDTEIEQRLLTPEVEPNTSLLRLAASFFSLASISVNLIDDLELFDSSEAMDFEDGVQTLDFDAWSRGLQDKARNIVVVSLRASSELQQRAEPNARALYRPQAQQSLYDVSNRFYGTPHNWRLIARRNGLTSFVLDGTELLIIPEVTGR